MDILTEEYERKRHVFDLCIWINDQLVEMEKLNNFDEIYFERKGNNIKKLLEEAVPISRLGLSLSKPGQNVYVTCLTGNQPYDAILEVTGYSQYEIKVEATTIETEETTMRRQAMSRNGTVWFSGPITRDGRNIKSEPEMVDIDKLHQEWIDLAFDRYLKKIEKGYDANTALLVFLETYRTIPIDVRAKLVKKTDKHLLEEKPNIHSVHYCYLVTNVVDSVYPILRKRHPTFIAPERAPSVV